MSQDPLLALVPQALAHFEKADPRLHAVLRDHPIPARTLSFGPPFDALVGSIAHQQVSLQAGRAIYARVEQACGGAVTPDSLIGAGPEALRAAGLSRPKVAYVLDLARKALTREVDLDAFPRMGDAEVVEALTRVKGIGVWTAKMFLLFHLNRPDVLPYEDLGLQIAVARLYGVPRERAAAKMVELGPRWSPYASVASLGLWNWRRAVEEWGGEGEMGVQSKPGAKKAPTLPAAKGAAARTPAAKPRVAKTPAAKKPAETAAKEPSPKAPRAKGAAARKAPGKKASAGGK